MGGFFPFILMLIVLKNATCLNILNFQNTPQGFSHGKIVAQEDEVICPKSHDWIMICTEGFWILRESREVPPMWTFIFIIYLFIYLF